MQTNVTPKDIIHRIQIYVVSIQKTTNIFSIMFPSKLRFWGIRNPALLDKPK
jgi:hypothetical protein